MRYVLTLLMMAMLTACQPGQAERTITEVLIEIINQQSHPDDADSKTDERTLDFGINKLELPSIQADELILYRTAYTASYDATNKIPRWVAWHLTAEHTSGEQGRLSNFIVDEDVPAPRAELADYKGSGYDRGHMCPAGDNKWGYEPMRESFLLTNICPQNRSLNCGDWNELEILCRNWANKYGDIYIVCGPILYKGEHQTIGPNKVTVPEAFFKVVLCMTGEPKGIGFIYKNEKCNNPKSSYVNTIDDVERITGLDFFPALPDDIEERIESACDLNDW